MISAYYQIFMEIVNFLSVPLSTCIYEVGDALGTWNEVTYFRMSENCHSGLVACGAP